MIEITVACRKRDDNVFTAQKYDNNEVWNTVGGTAPSGVHATRYLRKTRPVAPKLSPLAAWLVENVPLCVAGTMPHPNTQYRVCCYNGRTQFEQILHDAKTKKTVNCVYYRDRNDAIQDAHSMHECYGEHLDRPQRIDDWLFSIIEPNQDDTDYWNTEAEKMLSVGINRISVGSTEWRGE